MAGIWVQYGHALKESGNHAGGLEAYREALRLDPQNSDTALQIGHVLKLMGQRDEAARWYALSMLWPDPHPEGQRELDSLALPPKKLNALLGTLGAQPSRPEFVRWMPVPAPSDDADGKPLASNILKRVGDKLAASGSASGLVWDERDADGRALVVVAMSDLASLEEAAAELDRAWACGDVPVLALLCKAGVLQTATFDAGLVGKIDAVLRRCEGLIVPSLEDARSLDGRSRLLGLDLDAAVTGRLPEEDDFPRALSACVKRVLETGEGRAGNRPLVYTGEFVSFTEDGPGGLYKVGPRGGASEALGLPFDGDGLALRLPLAGPMLSEGRMSLALACTPGNAVLGAAVSVAGKTLGEGRIPLWRAGWGWLHVDLDTIGLGEIPVLDVALTLDGGATAEASGAVRLWLGGLIVYPRAADHLWFGFLDDASRHKVPVLGAMRAHGRRLAIAASR
jgi:hypothetical protein